MKVNLRAGIALLAGIALAAPGGQVAAQAPGQIPTDFAYYDYAQDESAPAPLEGGDPGMPASACGCETGLCDGGCGVIGGPGGGRLAARMLDVNGSRRGYAFFGADWLHLRANMSDAPVFLEQDTANGIETIHQADFDYNSSYRFFGGYRFSDCCGEVLFTYSRYRSDAVAISPEATAARTFIGPCEVIALDDGSQLTTSVDVDAQIYDVDFARILPLGSALGDCCDAWCPAWDLKWFFGVRYADVEWARGVSTTQANAQTTACGTRMDFDGAGPRIGLDGRRYIGCNGNFSVYARGAISLLLGDVDYVTNVQTTTVGAIPNYTASFTRIIPVTEIEVGGSVHLTNSFTVTGGYLFSAWHDLGMGDEHFVGSTVGPAVYDDANILGFDGAFVRAEVAY